MTKICQICGRTPRSGNSRSHSNVATLRTFGINLQTKKINGTRKKICVRCLKTASKIK